MRLLLTCLVFCTALAAEWPSFRGRDAAGVATGPALPETWDIAKGTNIRWKTPIPGLAHSSPIVTGDRIFLTTALSQDPKATFKPGLYGAGTASEDKSVHKFVLLCLDRRTGKVLWQRTAFEGTPKEKRHIKSTYANATPATDGKVVVAYFGSNGIHAFTVNGEPLWSRDLGRLDVGAYDAPEYEWGSASSPTLYDGKVIVQCDQQKGSFLIALDLASGKTLWQTERDELPSWGTPTVAGKSGNELIVTNGSNAIRGYSLKDGKQLWAVTGSSKITAPTPVFSGNTIVVCSGRRPEAPIFALDSSGKVLWTKTQRGSYMPTPLILNGILYVLGNAGIFDAYRLTDGTEIYRERIPHAGSGFSASPVSSNGLIYLPSEDGDVFVIKAGETFSIAARNAMNEPIMATPAISDGTLFIRTQHHLWAVGAK